MISPTELHASARKTKIGHLGGKGSYSHEAARKFFPLETCASFKHFEDVFSSLENGSIDYAVVPIENSSTGGIRDVYDLLVKCGLHIVGEVYVDVHHHLLGMPGTKLEDIKTVCSHPQGLMQSSDFIRTHGWQTKLCNDTGSAAAFVSGKGLSSFAAIASASAASVHGLAILKTDINNRNHNTTRFFVLSELPSTPLENGLTSFVFTTRHEPGCLYGALKHLARHNINMLRIESRPIENKPWEYYFFVDIEGSTRENRIQDALSALAEHTQFMRILGSYRRAID